MIDAEVFAEEWAVLNDRFPGSRSERVADRYYDYLDARMDTDTFLAASERIFAEEEHFPRPADFVEAVQGGVEERAREMWPEVRKVIAAYSPYPMWREGEEVYRHREMLEELPADVREAVRLLGGVASLAGLDREALWFRRREFIRLLRGVARAEERPTLGPPKGEAGRLVADVTESVIYEGPTLAQSGEA